MQAPAQATQGVGKSGAKMIWVMDPRVYTTLPRTYQIAIVNMIHRMRGFPVDPMNDNDCNLVLTEAQALRLALRMPFFPSEPSSPIHMWSPIASPARD